MNENLTSIVVLLDRSGSMASVKKSTESGFRDFLIKQQCEQGDATLTLYQFDDRFEDVYINQDIKTISGISLQPRGGTALYDAICKAIDLTGIKLNAMPESCKPGKVIFMIITDGEENASKLYSKFNVADRINHQRDKYSWQFLFIGANQDAIMTGGNLGMKQGSCLDYTANSVGTQNLYDSLSEKMSNCRKMSRSMYCSAVSSGTFFDDDDRLKQEDAKNA